MAQRHCAPMGVSIAAILIFSLIVWRPAGAGEQPLPETAHARYAWEHVLEDLKDQRDRLSGQLKTAHGALLPRAQQEEPKLVKKLSLKPPPPRPMGYGILPPIRKNEALKTVTPSRQAYSLETERKWLKQDLRDGAALTERSRANPKLVLRSLVAEFVRLRKRLRNVENQLAYHAKWQQAVIDYGAFFAERNRILALVRGMRAAQASGQSLARVTTLRREVQEQLFTFTPTPGIAIKTREDGTRQLAVTVYTDIEDDEFMAAFREGVEAAFVRSEAARALHFALKLEIRQIAPAALYPEGIPARGTAIDMTAHLARFPKGALILTTGGKSTHAWVGRNITLGSSPITRRTLAHEFGHLLGFSDAYLRAYEGDSRDPFGVLLIEWSGMVDNLMGASETGRVTEEMIERVIEGYGARSSEKRT